MPPRLPLGLLELSLSSPKLLSPAQRGIFARYLHQSFTRNSIIYPVLSLNGDQQQQQSPIISTPEREPLVFNEAITEFSESDLKAIYKDLLRLDVPPVKTSFKKTIQDPAVVLPRVSRRIGSSSTTHTTEILSSLSERLKSRLPSTIAEPTTHYISNGKPYSDLLNALIGGNVIPELPVLENSIAAAPVMSETEWISLIHACIQSLDFEGLFAAVRVMKKTGATVSKELCEHILSSMTQEGLFREIQAFATEFMTEYEDLFHFSYLLAALCQCRLYASAAQLLHAQESKGPIPPMDAYRALIRGLLRSPAPGATPRQAKAWDLFYHMRYVAHPTPSMELYTQMIYACSNQPEVDTLRAFDLWTEITVDKRITPTVGAYNAIIRVAAKTKGTASEAIRLAKQMVDLGRDAEGNPSLPMNYETYLALLEACKRLGDIEQARWVLTKLARHGAEEKSVIDHWVLRHVFHTYSSYTPPFKRKFATLLQPGVSSNNQKDKPTPSTEASSSVNEVRVHHTTTFHSEDPILPQTSQAVLAEADNLFASFMAERLQTQESGTSNPSSLFSNVTQPNLVAQAYISMYFHHSERITDAISKTEEVYKLLNLEWDPETIRMCMFHCAHSSKKTLSAPIIRFTDDIWKRFLERIGTPEQPIKTAWISYGPSTPAERRLNPVSKVNASTIVNIWAAYIHIHVRKGDMDGALSLVRDFVRRYPPGDVKLNLCPEFPLDSKASLVGPRALVRMSQRALVDDDTVPPILVFTDVSSLHRALVQAQRISDINALTYIIHSYAGSVRDRRGMNLLVDDINQGWQGRRHSEEDIAEKKRAIAKFEKKRRTGRLKAVLPR